MKASRYISALAAVILCLASCIRENIDDCDTPVEIDFVYYGNGIVDIFPERVDSVLMFIYEQPSGELVRTVELPKSALEERQGASLRLVPGDYRIVCWGNAGEGSKIDTSEGTICSSDYAGGKVPSGIEELYFGASEITVPHTLRPVRETMVYEASYIMMRVELIDFGYIGEVEVGGSSLNGLSARGTEEPTVTMTHADHSALIDFTNTPSQEMTDYLPLLEAHPSEDHSYIADYLVPRFDNGTQSRLEIVRNDTGATIFDRPVSELMDELDITIDRRNEQMVNLRLRLIVTQTGVQIEVLGWNTEIVFPDL